MTRLTLGMSSLALLLGCTGVLAAPPPPLDQAELFAFPGALAGPGSAASAGVALADRWLGDEPFWNPAASPMRGVLLAPALVRVSRQDLRADNRNYDETAAFFDVAGGWVAGGFGETRVSLFAFQPVLRREDNAFERGPLDQIPAVLASRSTARETRAGVAVSHGVGRVRIGVAGEWSRRADEYEYEEISGTPNPGLRSLAFDGDGFGFAAGASLRLGPEGAGSFELGVAVRQVPEITAEADMVVDVAAGDTTATFDVTREAAVEGGVSARWRATDQFAVLAGVGGRGAQAWDGLELESPASFAWSVGGVFHDARDPWTLRIGLGQERQDDAPESRAGVIGLGFGWKLEGATTLDLGVLRRSIDREDAPTSYDDRVVASVLVTF